MLRAAPRNNHPKIPARSAGIAHRRRTVRRGPVEFPGIVEDAKALGVDRAHLWRVLTGERPSVSLLARYRDLKARTAQVPAA